MQVQVISINAALFGGYPSIVWQGDIEPEDLGLTEPPPLEGHPPGEVNEGLFRFFNRVQEEDVERLRDLSFELPSLSVGDLVHWSERTFRVAGTGFEQITGSDDYQAALAVYALRSMKEGTE